MTHDGQCGHIEGDTGASLQLDFVQLSPTADNVARPICRLYDDWNTNYIIQNYIFKVAPNFAGEKCPSVILTTP